ncbi:hypothetical protein [Rhizobium sp. ZW T2_16]|uniref:hypothetical protein n=1 Tax=Rhizobium sp. ZW T2_16 TaxID=3378083 RepID=UPI0038549DC9
MYWITLTIFLAVFCVLAARKFSEWWLNFVKFTVGLIGSFAGLWSGINWLLSAEITMKAAQVEGYCQLADKNCLAQVENYWAAQAALIAAICLLGLWNADNFQKLRQ